MTTALLCLALAILLWDALKTRQRLDFQLKLIEMQMKHSRGMLAIQDYNMQRVDMLRAEVDALVAARLDRPNT